MHVNPKNKLIAAFVAACIMACALAGCSSSNNSPSGNTDSGNAGDAQSSEPAATPEAGEDTPKEITFDTPFDFDDLTITLGSGIQATVLDNQFSDQNGATVIAIPISVTNNSDETKGLNMFYYKAFGPDGTQLDDVSAYFSETDIAFAGEARPGATIESTLDILYTENGDYYIAFDNFKDKVEVRLPIAL